MKRSRLNDLMRRAVSFMEERGFHLPPFAFWGPKEWTEKGERYDEIRDNQLGWDITDFGRGDFNNIGLLLFTLRNGNPYLDKYDKTYAEKVLIVEEGQVTPYHFHWNKMEDIINRGGGNLMIELRNSTPEEKLAETPVEIVVDGRRSTIEAGERIRLTPGESITLCPGLYHKFWAEEGQGRVLAGEVSQVNDDDRDNRFLEQEKVSRFSELEEDEEPLYLLANEYPPAS